jgi:hypothetical protein
MYGCGLNSYGLGHVWMWTEFIWFGHAWMWTDFIWFGACMDVD